MDELEIKVTKQAVYMEEISEIDFVLQDELSTASEKEEFENLYINVDVTGKNDVHTDSHPIKIETIEKMLNDAKSKGATHVEIDYHCDHIGYIVAGYKIERTNK